jgi:LysR family glycine cleavage system transcriptional activator
MAEASTGTLKARLPPLLFVRAFEAVGRAGSMRKAAEDIGVNHTVVGRHVRSLERWFGTKLFVRGPRGTTLTVDGVQFFSAVSSAFDMIASSALQLRPQQRRGLLRVWCMPGLAARWLVPRLGDLEQALPGVDILVRAIDQAPDFSHFEADVMIGFAEPNDWPTDAMPLIEPRMFPVASPRWLKRHGVPISLEALARSSLIHEESRQQWCTWLDRAGVAVSHPLTGPRLWNASLCLDAALAGQGIALATRLTASDEIAAGNLVELFSTSIRVGGYYLYAPRERWSDSLLACFRKWIKAIFEQLDKGDL